MGRRSGTRIAATIIEYLPDWDKYGKSAGFKRNTTIVEACDTLLAFWDGKSRGTQDSIAKAEKLGKLTIVITYHDL